MSNAAAAQTPRPSTGKLTLQWAELLIEVSRQFASTLELDEVLGTVLAQTVQSVRASTGSIFLLDAEGRVVQNILARENLPPEVQRYTVAKLMDEGFAGWAYRNRRAGIIHDTESDARWHVLADDKLVTRSAMVAPLIRRERVIGIMTLMHPQPGRFTSRQLDFLEAIGAQAAAAVENAALYTRVSNERSTLQALIASVHDVILVTDQQDNLILANRAAQTALALSASEVGQPIGQAVRESAVVDFLHATADRAQATKEITFSDGRVFSCSLIDVPQVGRLLGLHDVTHFKQLDELKSEFVSHVAHDLKAPLAVMYGYVKILNELPEIDDDNRFLVEKIIAAIHRMRGLIENILDLGRIEMGIEAEFEIVSIDSIITDTVSSMDEMAEEAGVSLRAEVPPGLPHVNAAAVRLGQAVSNLIGNAIKFTPANGNVTVRAAAQNGEVVVKVIDTGAGIPPAMHTRLFQKFSKLGQKATHRQEGHGLGLAIVKSVVEAHHGRVWVESTVGEGSTFAFALPAHHAVPKL